MKMNLERNMDVMVNPLVCFQIFRSRKPWSVPYFAIMVDGHLLGSANLTFESIYKDPASGQTIVKLNGGSSLVILKEGTTDRILVNGWSEAKALGLSLQGTLPTAPATTLSGDFKKMIDGHGTPSTADDTYVIANGNYVDDGAEADALDLISGTAGHDVIDGKGGDDELSGMAGDDRIEGGNGSDVIQGGLGQDTINGGIGDDVIYGSSDMAITKPTQVDFTKPVNTYPHPQATGFDWTSGYYGTHSNGVPKGFLTNVPRNRLDSDKGNLIDGGAGDDYLSGNAGSEAAGKPWFAPSCFSAANDAVLVGRAA